MNSQEGLVNRLNARREELRDALVDIERQLDDEPPKDWEDRATERQGDEMLEALGQQDSAELRQIDAALDRVASGTYGKCTKCGGQIGLRRLEAVPATPFCQTCAI